VKQFSRRQTAGPTLDSCIAAKDLASGQPGTRPSSTAARMPRQASNSAASWVPMQLLLTGGDPGSLAVVQGSWQWSREAGSIPAVLLSQSGQLHRSCAAGAPPQHPAETQGSHIDSACAAPGTDYGSERATSGLQLCSELQHGPNTMAATAMGWWIKAACGSCCQLAQAR
jgi:hypothetical protein